MHACVSAPKARIGLDSQSAVAILDYVPNNPSDQEQLMIRGILTIVAIGMSTGIYADYIPGKMPICFDGESLKKYADYVANQNASGIAALRDAKRCITVPGEGFVRVPANSTKKMAGGEYPALTFDGGNGLTAWVLEVTVISE